MNTGPGDDRLLFLENATVLRSGEEVAFRNLSWTIRTGETWALVGASGSGKTTLAEVLRGRYRLEAGSIGWPFVDRLRRNGRSISWASEVMHVVSFKEDSWRFSYAKHYYQQRFNFIEPHEDLILDAFLRADLDVSDIAIATVARQLGIEHQLPLSLIKLSNGQIRRARIARALLANPAWLILDEPFMGLDVAGREEVADLLSNLIRSGVHLLLITRPDTIPPWVTHVAELEKMSIRWLGSRSDFMARRPPGEILPASCPQSAGPAVPPSATAPLIELRHVNVAYDERKILSDICWTVCVGQRWALLGPNGSGKTTLLSLLCGDHPQAYSNDIKLFGRQRGSGETIWEIKRHIGLVSPELHLYFSEPLSAAETAATGFHDVVSYQRTTPEQDASIRELFDYFHITHLISRPFPRLATGEQRLVLLIRALVKRPPLLILDEPFQGLDAQTIGRAQQWLAEELRPDQTLLFVSHHPDEIPRSVNRLLRLEAGHVAEIG